MKEEVVHHVGVEVQDVPSPESSREVHRAVQTAVTTIKTWQVCEG